jgi:hypothetical protein
MSCVLCKYLGQYALNWLNLLDHAGNTLLLGDANETMSARTARARRAGRRWATYACQALTWGAWLVTFGASKVDHCTYALDPHILPNSREIWDWNTGTILPMPETIVDDMDVPGVT